MVGWWMADGWLILLMSGYCKRTRSITWLLVITVTSHKLHNLWNHWHINCVFNRLMRNDFPCHDVFMLPLMVDALRSSWPIMSDPFLWLTQYGCVIPILRQQLQLIKQIKFVVIRNYHIKPASNDFADFSQLFPKFNLTKCATSL